MDRLRLSDELAMARRHVIRGRDIVERQRKLVARMKEDGHSTVAHEQLLAQFEQTLKVFEDHEQILRSEVAELQTRTDEKKNGTKASE